MRTRATRTGRAIVVRMEKGEEIIASLEKACSEHGVKAGLIFGIGALSKCTLYASESADSLELVAKDFEEPAEIASASGNATQKSGKPYIHLHAVLGLSDHRSQAGHLKSGIISLTGEFFIIELSGEFGRFENPALKMSLMEV